MKVNKYLIWIVFIVAISSCATFEELAIGPVQDVKVQKIENGIMKVVLNITIENPNSTDLKLKNTDLMVTNGNVEMGKITQIDNLVIEGKTKKVYEIPVIIELTNPSAPLASALSFLTGKKPDIRIKGKLTAGSFLINRTVLIDQPIPLNF